MGIRRRCIAGCLALGFICLSSEASAQTVIQPLRLAVRPLRYGAEFVPGERSDTVFKGQTLTVFATLKNLGSEPIQLEHDGEGWADSVDVSVKRSATAAGTRVENVTVSVGLQVELTQVSNKVWLFRQDSAQELKVSLPASAIAGDGDRLLEVRLRLQASAPGGVPVPIVVDASLPFNVAAARSKAERLEATYREAWLARTEERLKDARDLLASLLTLSPSSSAARILLGDIAAKEGDVKAARSEYAAALQLLTAQGDVDSYALKDRDGRVVQGRLSALERKLQAAPR